MNRLMLVLVGLSALPACSDSRERRISVAQPPAQTQDLTLPDTNLVRDTSSTTAVKSEPPVSPIEQQQAPRAEAPKPKRKHVAAVRRRSSSHPDSSAHTDTTVRAYAPGALASSDSASRSDTSSRARSDTSQTTRSDTAPALPDTGGARPDTARTPDSAASRLASRESDSTATRGDTARATPDTAVTASDSAAAEEPNMAAAPPTNTSASSTAARTLPVGTEIHAALDDSITSRRDTVGQQVSGHIMENVTGAGGQTLIAAGTPVQFTITRIRASYSKSSQGRLALQANGIAFNGRVQPVQADIQPVPRELQGRGVGGSEAAKVGGGAAAGAVLGGVVGGSTKGAVIGGVAGAAAGAVVANQTATRDVVVKAKTPLVLRLTAPLVPP
jgi:hypothetical protein